MKTTQKICAVLMPVGLMMAAPLALAQVAPADTIKLATQEHVNTQPPASWHGKDVAIRGRDVVSFSQDSGPVEGSAEYVAEWDDTKWYFKNKENRDTFQLTPEKYVPEFGGWCPVALSRGVLKVGRTNQFTRVEEKLYFNYNKANRDTFAADPNSFVLKAQLNW